MSDKFWISLQVRPVGDYCNIGCSYCVYGQAPRVTRMSDNVLETMTKKTLLHNGDGALFNWHGGEPTLAGIKFYQKAVEYQKKYSSPEAKILNQIQTNAVNLTAELAQFFAQHNFGIGVSLDGPNFLHDATRQGKQGQSTHQLVCDGIETLRQYGNKPAVIATVSKQSLPYAKETFHHVLKLGFTQIHYSVVFESKLDRTQEVSSEEWYKYLSTVFQTWIENGNPDIEVRELNEVISWIAETSEPSCTSTGTCAHWFVVDYDGALYPCEVLGRDRHYGNILENDFSDVISGPKHQELVRIAAARPEKCGTCKFLKVCNNGCTNMRTRDGQRNQLGLYAYCNERLNLFEEIQKTFSSVS